VAGFAVLLELSLVGVFFVAVAAIGKGHLPDFLSGEMALFTGQGTMFSPQGITGAVMVKGGDFP
jgi:hypothetical protein